MAPVSSFTRSFASPNRYSAFLADSDGPSQQFSPSQADPQDRSYSAWITGRPQVRWTDYPEWDEEEALEQEEIAKLKAKEEVAKAKAEAEEEAAEVKELPKKKRQRRKKGRKESAEEKELPKEEMAKAEGECRGRGGSGGGEGAAQEEEEAEDQEGPEGDRPGPKHGAPIGRPGQLQRPPWGLEAGDAGAEPHADARSPHSPCE